jgi:hypothetical protein
MFVALDSDALTEHRAKQKGQNKTININRLIFFQLMEKDHLDLCFTYDVIEPKDDTEGRATFENTKYIEQYVPDIIPIYHPGKGKDLKFLEVYLRESPIVAIGGGADDPLSKRRDYLGHLWRTNLLDRNRRPRAMIHGLGLTAPELIRRWSWYSVDSQSWAIYARNYIICVPQKSGSQYVFTEQPIRISVTTRNPYPNNHITRLPAHLADYVIEWIDTLGFSVAELGDDRTARCAINAVFYSEMGWASGTKVYLAGNYECTADPEMERRIRDTVFARGLDYHRLICFADKLQSLLNVIRMKKEESYGSESQGIETGQKG